MPDEPAPYAASRPPKAPPVRTATRARIIVLRVLVVSLLATLAGRMWVLQVQQGPHYQQLAKYNQVRDLVTQPPRGEIVDDVGRPLLDNRIALVVKVNREKLISGTYKDVDQYTPTGDAVMRRLARVLGTTAHALKQQVRLCTATVPQPCWNGSPYQPIPVGQLSTSSAATRRALQILETKERFPGVTVETQPVRHYPKPEGALASAVLGYIGPISKQQLAKLPLPQRAASTDAEVGETGLEAAYEKYLHGRPGIKEVAVDAQGNPTGVIKNTPPRPGDVLVTNLDAKVQATLEKSLQERLNQQRSQGFTADWAAGVVLNARTGGVVAMGSVPTYQPDIFDNRIGQHAFKKLLHAKGSPLYDKAYQGTNPPGSTFKLITSLGAIKDGTTTVNTTWPCPSMFGGKRNFDGESAGGSITLQHAIQISCDTFFYEIGARDWTRDKQLVDHHKKPIEGVQHMARRFGIGGSGPGVDLPNAATGSIGDRANQKAQWRAYRKDYCAGARRRPKSDPLQALDAYNCKYGYIFQEGDQESEDIGQESVTASPLEMAVAYAAMANGGTIFEPRVAKAVLSPSGKLIKRIKAPVRGHIPLPKSDLDYLRNAFYSVVTGGTGAGTYLNFPLHRVRVGGKTGTAELSGTSQNAGWFVSFAGPANGKPQYVTVIEVDRADQGANSAAPASRQIWDAIYGLEGHKPIFPNGVPPRKIPHPANGTAPSHPKATPPRRHAHGKGAGRRTNHSKSGGGG
jgi:penicillin-binding protein 2